MTLRIRGGTDSSAPETDPYGPTIGRAAVIAAAGPRAVTDPGGIAFTTRLGLQNAIVSNPSNSTFVFSGTVLDYDARVLPQSKNPTIIFPGVVGAKVIDGANRQFSPVGFGGTGQGPFTIRGGTWQKFGPLIDTTNPCSIFQLGAGSLIEDVEVRDCPAGRYFATGVGGSNCRIAHSRVHNIGGGGLGGSASSASHISNVTVEFCELYQNGINWPGAPLPVDGGSGKWSYVDNVIYRNNYVHDDDMFGPWPDTSGLFTCTECVIEDVEMCAPFLEVAYEGAEVANNWLARNGQRNPNSTWFDNPVLNIAASDPGAGEFNIHHNHIEGSYRLFGINNQTGRPHTRKVNFHNNRMKMTAAAARFGAWAGDIDAGALWSEPTITYTDNLYQGVGFLPDNNFTWRNVATEGNGTGTNKTWAQWQSFGHDLTSTREIV